MKMNWPFLVRYQQVIERAQATRKIVANESQAYALKSSLVSKKVSRTHKIPNF